MNEGVSLKSKIVYIVLAVLTVVLIWLGDEGKQPIVYLGTELQHSVGLIDSESALVLQNSIARYGNVANTPSYVVNRGSYQVDLVYSAEDKDSVLELWEQGDKIAAWPINSWEKELSAEFTLSKDAKALQFRINYSGTGSLVIKKLTFSPKTLFYTDTYFMMLVVLVLSLVGWKCFMEGEMRFTQGQLLDLAVIFGAAKIVVFCNAPEDNPFMAGAFHGVGEYDCEINVGVSGPGVVRAALEKHPDANISEIADVIKKTAFKITRMGQLVGTEASRRLGVPFGIVDLSLAPTPAVGDSVAHILEEIGLESCGAHGTTACLAMLNDAVKKGGVMASSHVGGLSGAFIPVSEDAGMIDAVNRGSLSLEKLEAMTAVCSVGLDMIVVPGDTSADTISAIIADEAAIGMVNSKTTAVRVIPAIGMKEGDTLEFGGLFGSGPVMPVSRFSSSKFISRGGRIPAPLQSLKN